MAGYSAVTPNSVQLGVIDYMYAMYNELLNKKSSLGIQCSFVQKKSKLLAVKCMEQKLS